MNAPPTPAAPAAPATARTRTILRHRVREDVLSMPLLWAAFVVATAAVIALVAIFRADGIEVSGWEQATQLTRWYAGAMGVYFTAVYLPLYITHGVTRREYLRQLPVLFLAFTAMYALLMTVGFGIETLAYRLMDWPHELLDRHLFTELSQVGRVYLEFLLTGVAWVVGGALVGAGFYRSSLLGALCIPASLFIVAAPEAVVGTGYLGPLRTDMLDTAAWLGSLRGSALWATLITAVVAVAGFLLLRAVARDLPIRTPAN